MTSRPNVLVIQNTSTGTASRFGDWLREDGLDLDVALAFDGTPLPTRLEHDAILVLGGGFLPDDDERAPWLPRTRSLVTQALDESRPVLGICLGGQLLAHVAGGTVSPDTGRPEFGSTALTLHESARYDALFAHLPSDFRGMEHHVDAITALPAGATWLAASERCPYQAFRVGDLAWGTQFHPEIAAHRILEWDAAKLERRGINRQDLYEAALADEPTSSAHWRALATRFALICSGRNELSA